MSAEAGPSKSPKLSPARPTVQALLEDDQPESDVFAQLAAEELDADTSSAPVEETRVEDDSGSIVVEDILANHVNDDRRELELEEDVGNEEDLGVSGPAALPANQASPIEQNEDVGVINDNNVKENGNTGLSDAFNRLNLEESSQMPADAEFTDEVVETTVADETSTTEAGHLFGNTTDDGPEDDIFAQLIKSGGSGGEQEEIAETEQLARTPTVPASGTAQPQDANEVGISEPLDLFEKSANDQPEHDLFAQLSQSDVSPVDENSPLEPERRSDDTTAHAQESTKPQEAKLHDLFADEPSDDPFAQIGQPTQEDDLAAHDAQTPSSAQFFEAFKGNSDSRNGEAIFATLAHSDQPFESDQAKHERDYSDLLAEFEDDDMAAPVVEAVGQNDPHGDVSASATAAHHLFHDQQESSPFDNILGHDDSQSTSQLDGSAMHGGSTALAYAASTETTANQDEDGSAPIPFDIPLGWYDDAGNWNWYTDEEKEQVRLAMFAQGDIAQPGAQVPNTPVYSPALGVGVGQSENAARRTPQPEAQSARMASDSYNPYAPPPSFPMPGNSSPYTPAASSSYSSLYGDQQRSATSTSTAAVYDPYSPSTQAGSSHAPYGIAVPSYRGPSSAPSTASRAPVQAAERPAPPKRVISNAYDPPLRPQKSFVRPASALASTPTTMTPAPPVPVALLPQSSTPAPPPAGPPRRSKTPSAPSYAAPPSRAMSSTEPNSYQAEVPPVPPLPQQDSYAPSSDPQARKPEQFAVASPPAQQKPPPRNQSYSSFDPPLRPSSAARARAAGPARSVTPPISALAPPPATAPPPSGPPRGPSRSSIKKPSPMFEGKPSYDARPPSRGTSAIVRSHSPLVPAAEIPSRPESRPRIAPIEPSGLLPPTLSSREEYDPEGGLDEEDGVTPPVSANRFFQEDLSASELDTKEIALEADEGQPPGADYHLDYERRVSTPTAPNGAALYAAPPGDADRSPARNDPKAMQTPAREPKEPSSYDPSPYQPSPAQARPQPSQKEAYTPESYGLGLHTTGSPPPASHIYDSYAPAPNPPPQNTYTPYGPTSGPTSAPEYGQESGSYDPYAPTSQDTLLHSNDGQPKRALSPSYTSDYGISPPQPSYFQNMHAAPADNTYVPQQVLEQKPISEDPLGRSTLAARNTPLAVFGFGGVLITAFPAQAESDRSLGHNRTPSYGYASGRGQLWIRTVSDLASTSALKPNDNVFPGPLVLDPSTPKGAAGDKKKREAISAYLQARAEEIEKGLPYLKSSANAARREEEGKLVMVRILLAMILGEGKLSGKAEVEDALRDAFSSLSSSAPGGVNILAPIGIAQPGYSADQHSSNRASPSSLLELGQLLSRGDKREAAQYAAKRGLWAHALVIASSVDPESWSETVLRFAEAELHSSPDGAALRAAYAVFSGRTATSVEELMQAANLSGDLSQDRWREVVSAVVFNGKPADLACLDELGTRFRQAGLNYPAHVCHLLSPNSPFSDFTPSAFDRPVPLVQNSRDDDAIVFAEVAEYARSLVVLPKGQESPVFGLPQLLPYKLQRAWLAAELGEIDQAKRYCTAIEAASKVGKNGPSVLPPALLASLEDLNERLTGTPSANPARLIGGRKASKAGLGSWIEGRLSKFIAGEEDSSAPVKPTAPASKSDVAGPFSHFSTISPAASGAVTRTTSTAEFTGISDSVQNSPYGMPSRLSEVQQYGAAGDTYGTAYSSWSSGQEVAEEDEQVNANTYEGEGEFINPMAAFSVGGPRDAGPSDYQPKVSTAPVDEEDDDEDLGFGNVSLSRGKTPRPAVPDSEEDKKGDSKAAPTEGKKAEPETASPAKADAKGGWLKGWWGKKEGEGSGPIKAKLGDESSMVYDKELKRWVVKGAKPEPVAAAPPPPPRAQTASPSHAARPEASSTRATSATPPPLQASRNGPPLPGGGLARSSTAPLGFTEMPDGQIKRQKSSLAESITANEATSGPPGMSMTLGAGPPGGGPPMGGPPKPPSRPATASIDDLLSRPPSKRPGSAAKKSMRNKYVDVLQPGT